MRRRILTMFALLLLAGAIVNVAIALAGWQLSALRMSGGSFGDAPSFAGDDDDRAVRWVACFTVRYGGRAVDAALQFPMRTQPLGTVSADALARALSQQIDLSTPNREWPFACSVRFVKDAGWPLRSLRGEHISRGVTAVARQESPGRYCATGVMIDAMQAARVAPAVAVVPRSPLWPGFALNALFYAAFLWLLIRGPHALRRARRRRRGLCLVCGYDLRGREADQPRCPECGGALAAPSL